VLTAANGIEHTDAHDAVADVRVTLAMARLVKEKQPKLYDWLFQLRSKHRVLPLLDLVKQEPVLHVSRMFAANRGCLAVVLPLCRHPVNSNGIVVADLQSDPRHWIQLDADTLRQRLYTRSENRPEGEARIPLKTVHINRCPALAPMGVLNDSACERNGIDLAVVQRHREQLLAVKDLAERVQQVFRESDHVGATDADLMLYGGSFFGDGDKRLMQRIRQSRPESLATFTTELRDPRLPELLFRYRARNFPYTLTIAEQQRWQEHCRNRLLGQVAGAGVTLQEFERLLQVEAERIGPALQLQLREYAESVAAQCGIAVDAR
jgi:exodeoxyribonuclease-1